MELAWFCAQCMMTRQLDQHGRCNTCGSDAVTLEVGTPQEFWLDVWAKRTSQSLQK